jgi:hypothetical protein
VSLRSHLKIRFFPSFKLGATSTVTILPVSDDLKSSSEKLLVVTQTMPTKILINPIQLCYPGTSSRPSEDLSSAKRASSPSLPCTTQSFSTLRCIVLYHALYCTALPLSTVPCILLYCTAPLFPVLNFTALPTAVHFIARS